MTIAHAASGAITLKSDLKEAHIMTKTAAKKIVKFGQTWTENEHYTVAAAAVIQLVTGLYFVKDSLVSSGMNERFRAINEIHETMPEGTTIGQLKDAWLESMKSR